ncbi:MAG: NAD-dependent malic enzyme 1 [Deltaproteobacteria bacterium RIFOXYA12_FULL_58_15]|nr:MAG: NAD-dependent malic enzyme 1 [Deltaproteobacteria bacterium RIFOXYA12_FULL_58_15]OGR11058.1 MAG: NAD-dependent malic enzyme 1 [Deltaproteobacteria bacterium RIFOXYB12_FULL_58_9]
MQHETSSRIIKRMRVKFRHIPCYLGNFASMVAEFGGAFGEIRSVQVGKDYKIRDIDITVRNEEIFDQICDATRRLEGVDLIEVKDVVEEVHRGGKIEVTATVDVKSVDDLRIVYTPGVASVCRKIAKNPELRYEFTSIPNNVAIVTNGTAILGLGDIGPVAGMPVMEGKALLFKLLAGINGFPILIDSKDPEVIVATVKAIAKTFGAIKLEDIKAPECFEIEDKLDAALDIPVVHDDQHGTAVVVLAALINIAKLTYINLRRSSVGIVGLGAAGSGIAKLLSAYGVNQLHGADINEEMSRRFKELGGEAMNLQQVMERSDIVIATTGVPGLIAPEWVRPKQVILALSNPDPEITPEAAMAAGARYSADGKSVNNALAFPGLFKGALMARARRVNNAMKIAAAQTIASFAEGEDLIPDILNKEVHAAVAKAVEQAALKTGVAKTLDPDSVGAAYLANAAIGSKG